MTQETTDTLTRVKYTVPNLFNVIFHNDDTTSMDFVVMLLTNIFDYHINDAYNLMMKIHLEGAAVVGTFTKEIAESKKRKVRTHAEANGFHNFKVTVELQ